MASCYCFSCLQFREEFILVQVFQSCGFNFSVRSVRKERHENFAIVAASFRIDVVFLERETLLEW